MQHRLATIIAATLFALVTGYGSAWAATCSVPNIFVNNTVADANTVNANFTAVLACINVNNVVGPNSSTLHNVACYGNTAGNLLEACASIPVAQLPVPGASNALPANPSGTINTSLTMMGLGSGCTVTAGRNGKITFVIHGNVQNSSTGFLYQLRYNNGSAPSNGAAVAGNAVSAQKSEVPAGGTAVPFSDSGEVSGLTPGTAYWFDEAVAQFGGSGTVILTNLTCHAMES